MKHVFDFIEIILIQIIIQITDFLMNVRSLKGSHAIIVGKCKCGDKKFIEFGNEILLQKADCGQIIGPRLLLRSSLMRCAGS
jgi:hypothetical protein